MAVTNGMSEKQSNPIPVVDAIIEEDSKILFARRKKEPFKDRLGFPGGFVNLGPTRFGTSLMTS
jgi:ADP-ribose pyrophosphatase YjhB (NUDIX family)